jgi:hypothetical protein
MIESHPTELVLSNLEKQPDYHHQTSGCRSEDEIRTFLIDQSQTSLEQDTILNQDAPLRNNSCIDSPLKYDKVWTEEVEKSFQDALRLFPLTERNRAKIKQDGKLYGACKSQNFPN